MSSTGPGATQDETRPVGRMSSAGPLRASVMAMLGLLAVQFVLGMYANLDVALPSSSGSSMRTVMPTVLRHVGLLLHAGLGFVLLAAGVVALISSMKTGIGKAIWLAVAGLTGLIVAGIGGMTFLMAGQGNSSSYLMAIGFLVSFSCYFAELVVTQ